MNLKPVGIDRRLVIATPKTIAHLHVKFRDRRHGVRDLARMRRDQINAPVGGDHLLVIREGPFIGGLGVERGALFLGSCELG